MAGYRYDVALSFAGEDRPYVDEVAHHLRDNDVTVFYDAFEQVDSWGKSLYEHLQYVYRDASRFAVLFSSQRYAEKVWTRYEQRAAQARALEDHRGYILPARFDSTAIPGIDAAVVYLDCRALTPQELARSICQKIGRDFKLFGAALDADANERSGIHLFSILLNAIEEALQALQALLGTLPDIWCDDTRVVAAASEHTRRISRLYDAVLANPPGSLSSGPEYLGDAANIDDDRLPKSFTFGRAVQPIRYRAQRCLDQLHSGRARTEKLDSPSVLQELEAILGLFPKARPDPPFGAFQAPGVALAARTEQQPSKIPVAKATLGRRSRHRRQTTEGSLELADEDL